MDATRLSVHGVDVVRSCKLTLRDEPSVMVMALFLADKVTQHGTDVFVR